MDLETVCTRCPILRGFVAKNGVSRYARPLFHAIGYRKDLGREADFSATLRNDNKRAITLSAGLGISGRKALKARSIPAWGNAPGFGAHKMLKG